jgi:hypothetical protein
MFFDQQHRRAMTLWRGVFTKLEYLILNHPSSNGRTTLQDLEDAGLAGRGDARVENLLICKAAFEKALFVYPDAHLEMRQGARIILKSKEEPPSRS